MYFMEYVQLFYVVAGVSLLCQFSRLKFDALFFYKLTEFPVVMW